MKPDKTIILIRKFASFQEFLSRFELEAGDGDGEWHETSTEDKDDWLTPKTLFRCCNPAQDVASTLRAFLHAHSTPYQTRATYDEDGTTNFATYLADLNNNETNVFRVLDPDGDRVYAPMGTLEPISLWRTEAPILNPHERREIFTSKLLFA